VVGWRRGASSFLNWGVRDCGRGLLCKDFGFWGQIEPSKCEAPIPESNCAALVVFGFLHRLGSV
jgi:hypothetical protein